MKLYLLEHHIDKLSKSFRKKKTDLNDDDTHFNDLYFYSNQTTNDSRVVAVRTQTVFLPKHYKIRKKFLKEIEEHKHIGLALRRKLEKECKYEERIK